VRSTHGLDAVVLHAEFEDLADFVGDGIEVPDVAMIMLTAGIGVANVLVREGDARVFRGDVAEKRYGSSPLLNLSLKEGGVERAKKKSRQVVGGTRRG